MSGCPHNVAWIPKIHEFAYTCAACGETLTPMPEPTMAEVCAANSYAKAEAEYILHPQAVPDWATERVAERTAALIGAAMRVS